MARDLHFIAEVYEITRNNDMSNVVVAVPHDYVLTTRITRPLNVTILYGTITYKDMRASDADAIICVGVLEHLRDNELGKVPCTVFRFIRPKIAIFTTLNQDFNEAFYYTDRFPITPPAVTWTKDRFHSWASGIVNVYLEYTVKLHGIAPGPEGSEPKFAAQMAVFTLKSAPSHQRVIPKGRDLKNRTPHRLIGSYLILWWNEVLTKEEHVVSSIIFHIKNLRNLRKYNKRLVPNLVPVAKMLPFTTCFDLPVTEAFLRDILIGSGYGPLVPLKNGSYAIALSPMTRRNRKRRVKKKN